MIMQSRDHWGSRLGFILAAAGSAVGLGNIWRFPYITGQSGGGAFLIIYLILVFTLGLSVMLAEFAVGRAAQRNPVGAYARLRGGVWPLFGYIGVGAGFIILSFYTVVAGWTLAYAWKALSGTLSGISSEQLGQTFGAFISSPLEPLLYSGAFMIITVGVILGGVGAGIERACKVLMPVLFLILLVLVVRAVTLPGAEAGLRFFLEPDFSELDADMFNAALGQAFFSLSLGMGAMLTYGSYLSHRENLPGSALWVTSLDSSVALLAGLVVLPAVFAFGFDPAGGPGLAFITLPAVFAQMPAGQLFAVLFFVLLAIAALTSAVSLLEVVVAYLVDEREVRRGPTAVGLGILIFLLGIPSSLSMGMWSGFTLGDRGFLDLMDYLTSNLMLPIGGIGVTVFAGWVVAPRLLAEASSDGRHPFPLAPVWLFICRFIAPLGIAWILVSGL